jgi:hypothetical protein
MTANDARLPYTKWQITPDASAAKVNGPHGELWDGYRATASHSREDGSGPADYRSAAAIGGGDNEPNRRNKH